MNPPALVIKRTIKADRHKVFEAWTSAPLLEQWFLPMNIVSVNVTHDFRVGGQYQIDMHSPDGEIFPHRGEYREIIPDEKLAFTWNSDWVTDTLVTLQLRDTPEGTEITLTHEMLPDEESWKEHQEGWNSVFDKIGKGI